MKFVVLMNRLVMPYSFQTVEESLQHNTWLLHSKILQLSWHLGEAFYVL